MNKTLALIGVIVAILIAGFLFFGKDVMESTPLPTPDTPEPQACNGDAKICEDGSTVGRTGPNCEFAACPAPDRTSATVTTYLDGSPTAMNVTLQPKQVVSDSRCPTDVQCIWAGTVEVRTVMSTQVSHGEEILTLGEPVRFGDFMVTLTDVTPYPKEAMSIPDSSYRFTYKIEKR